MPLKATNIIMMKVNEIYQQWKENPSVENYELLGEAILQYVKLMVKNKFGQEYITTYEEGIGQSLIKIFETLDRVDLSKGTFAGWVGEIIQNTCYNITRDRRIHGLQKEQMYNDNWFAQKEDPVRVEQKLAREKVANILNREDLTEKDKLLIRLKLEVEEQAYDKGWNEAQGNEWVAEKLGIALKSCEKRWTKLKKKLQKP